MGESRHTVAVSTPSTITLLTVDLALLFVPGVVGADEDGQTAPQAAETDDTWTGFAVGRYHTCGLGGDGTIFCWGCAPSRDRWKGFIRRVSHGQCGEWRGHFVQVTAGDRHTCGLSDDGAITCWGQDEFGQLQVPEGTYLAVTGGRSHTCALDINGAATCWGLDTGQPPRAHRATVSAPDPYPSRCHQGPGPYPPWRG